MEENDRETRKEVKDLCELLGGEMIENSVDQFRLNGFQIDLSATNLDYLGIITIKQFEKQARNYGKIEKMTEVRKALDI